MEIRVKVNPQPVKLESGFWRWHDISWSCDSATPTAEILKYCPFKKGDPVNIDGEQRKVAFATVGHAADGTWDYAIFIEPGADKRPRPRKHKPEEELLEYARSVSQKLTIRTYLNGNSHDAKMPTDNKTRPVLESIVFGTLLALEQNENIRRAQYGDPIFQTVLAAAEFTAHQLIPGINSYDSVYIPIWKYVDAWEREGEPKARG